MRVPVEQGGAAVSSGDGKDGGNGTKSFWRLPEGKRRQRGNGAPRQGQPEVQVVRGWEVSGGSGASADPADQGDDAGNSNYASAWVEEPEVVSAVAEPPIRVVTAGAISSS